MKVPKYTHRCASAAEEHFCKDFLQIESIIFLINTEGQSLRNLFPGIWNEWKELNRPKVVKNAAKEVQGTSLHKCHMVQSHSHRSYLNNL